MGSRVVTKFPIAADVPVNGTINVPYPVGYTQLSMMGSTGGQVSVEDNEVFRQDVGSAFTFGASTITVQNLSPIVWTGGRVLTIGFGRSNPRGSNNVVLGPRPGEAAPAQGGGVDYDSDALAYFNAMTGTALPTPQRTWVNEAVVAWKNNGAWPLIQHLCLPLQDSQASRVSLKNPAVVESVINAVTFTPYRGFMGDGSTSYIDSTYAVDGPGLGQNSQTLYAYINSASNDAPATAPIAGMDTTTGVVSFLRPRATGSGALQGRVNAATTQDGAAATTRLGGCAVSRTGAGLTQFFKDGLQSGADISTVSGTVQTGKTVQWLRLATGYNGIDRISARMIGSGMTIAQLSSFHATLLTLLTKLGAN